MWFQPIRQLPETSPVYASSSGTKAVVPLAATFALRALMSLLLHVEMRGQHKTEE